MPTKSVRSNFMAGMVPEALDSMTPDNGSYEIALNAIHSSRTKSNFGLVNEESNELAVNFGAPIVGWSHIEERNQTLYFLADDSLWLHSHGSNKKTFVCRASEFGCDWGFSKCEFLYGEFKSFNHCDELHVYWSSDCIYHVVNIDEMLDPVRKAAVIECEDCSYFDVFKAACGPHLSATPALYSGSALECGVYQFAVQLEDRDGNYTNVFDISQPAIVTSEDNIAGQPAKASVRFTMSNLDSKYSKVILYVIRTVRGVTVIEKMLDTLPYSDKGLTYTYYGQKGEIVDAAVLTTKAKGFLRGQDLIQKDGRLFFYNIKNERNLNYQKYANQIQVEWVEWEVSMEMQEKYHFPSLMRGEVYALGIVWRYLDGTFSDVFHIPAGGGGGGTATTSSSKRARKVDRCFDGNGDEIPCPTGGNPTSQDPVGGGGAGDGASGAASDTYQPLDPSDLDTEDQFRRERNPSEVKDRPNESDFLEEFTLEDVQAIDTDRQDMIESGACHDNLYGCSEAEEAMEEDLRDLERTVDNNAELIALFGRDYPDPPLNQTDNIKDAGIYLIENAVIEREYIVMKRPTLTYSGTSGSGPGGSPVTPTGVQTGVAREFSQEDVGINTIDTPRGAAASLRGDNWVDSLGNSLTDEPIRRVATGSTQPYTSTVQYPDSKDCDGQRFYPGGNVRHHRIPWSSERPHFVSFQNGVVNKYQPENYEYGKTYVRPIGLRFTNVRRPQPDELPKPLCPHSPFKIVYVQRTDQNKSVFAKGWCSGMFIGQNHGATYNFPRHGVNSFETVDRMINVGDNSRKGEAGGDGAYTFHSPDTDCDNSFLPVTHVKAEGALRGSGWRHGLYAQGKEVRENNFQGTRKDNRGARVANNINHFQPGGGMQAITGITYAPGDTVVTAASGMQRDLMNKFRESSVYVECGALPGSEPDKSFVGDVMDHFCPTTANAPYAALVRELPDQYGSVEGLRYSDLGINATLANASGGTTIEGVCGDTFIGPYSKRRTSYISNKVGDFFHPPPKPGSPCRERSWCDSPDDKIFQYFGIDHYPTKLPKSGDLWDPKNYAGLHTVGGNCGEFGLSRKCPSVPMVTETDFYWPRTLKSLVHTVVESHVNPWLRETGQGSQLEDGKVWYPRLKDLHLDPDAPVSHPWEETYLGRFYEAVEQPSRAVIAKKILIRTMLNMIAPAAYLNQFQDMQGIVDVVSTFFIFPMLAAFWIMGTNTLFTDRRIDQFLGIDYCRRDEEGGDLDEHIENWEDNFCAYNWDFSKVNDLQPYHAFPLPYNTCDCDSCQKPELNNEIYHSNKQNLDSEIDAYRHVRLNNYMEIPGHAGKIQRLFAQGNGFFAHATDGIWILKLAEVTVPMTDVAHQQAGTGELLAEPQLMIEGPFEGYAGTQHPNAAINTSFGYFFVDDVAEKIYRFNGQLEEISAYGLFNFFKENLRFCSTTSCYDEKTSSDNHYSLGWDPRYNRLLVTKFDGNPESSWTLSYTPLGVPNSGGGSRGKWVSFHSYIPQGYNWDRNNFYSIKGSEVWKHHVKNSYQTFYGELFPFMVQFAARAENLEAFDFKQFRLDTEAERWQNNGFVRDLDITFNKLAIWNSTQGTGTRPVEWISDNAGAENSQRSRTTHDPSKIRLHKVRRNWNAMEIADLRDQSCSDQPLLIYPNECQVIPDVNESIFDCNALNKQDYFGRILSDKFIAYRFIFDEYNDVRLYLKMMTTFHDEKQLDP